MPLYSLRDAGWQGPDHPQARSAATHSGGTFCMNPISKAARSLEFVLKMLRSMTFLVKTTTSWALRTVKESACNVSQDQIAILGLSYTFVHCDKFNAFVYFELPVVDNLELVSDNGLRGWGRKVIHVCVEGYSLADNSGRSTRTCQKNGTWSGVTPTCLSKYIGSDNTEVQKPKKLLSTPLANLNWMHAYKNTFLVKANSCKLHWQWLDCWWTSTTLYSYH